MRKRYVMRELWNWIENLMVRIEYLHATLMDFILSVILAHSLYISMKHGQLPLFGEKTSPGYWDNIAL